MRYATYRYHHDTQRWERRHVFQAKDMDEAVTTACAILAPDVPEIDPIRGYNSTLLTCINADTGEVLMWQVTAAEPLVGNPHSLEFL